MFDKEEEFQWSEEFFKDDFSVDHFLSQNTNKSDLSSIRNELKKFGSELHTCMSEILRNETEDIVNLAEALSNLNSNIDELIKPASQLQEEVRVLYDAVKSAKSAFETHLEKGNFVKSKRDFLKVNIDFISKCIDIERILGLLTVEKESFSNKDTSLNRECFLNEDKVLNEDDLMLLERAVEEFSFRKAYAESKGVEIRDASVNILEGKLISVLQSTYMRSLKERNEEVIERSLRMYVNLKRQDDAEKIHRREFVKPSLSAIFTQKNLDSHGQNLNEIYRQALSFLHEDMKPLKEVLRKNPDLKGYDFVMSFWGEADELIRVNLPNVTAPGNPELFQRRFNDTFDFLREIAAAHGSSLSDHETFLEHLKRFNLPVYFEIRFQQIAGAFERAILANEFNADAERRGANSESKHSESKYSNPESKYSNSESKYPNSESKYSNSELRYSSSEAKNGNSDAKSSEFKSGNSEFKGLKEFKADFNSPFKLKVTNALWASLEKCFKQDVFIGHLTGQFVKLSLLLLSRYLKWIEVAFKSVEGPSCDEFLVLSLVDLKILKENALKGELDPIYAVIPKETEDLFKKVQECNAERIEEVSKLLSNNLVELKRKECCEKLQEVTAVPRLYRRTNRSVPTEPSGYILAATVPIVNLHKGYERVLEKEVSAITDQLVVGVTETYLNLCMEVLHSVCKTEKSLRRLKNRSSNVNEDQISGDLNSDEGKIREQIRLDVEYFCSGLETFAEGDGRRVLGRLREELRLVT